jgi:ABC-type amino acid transport substrate-binding protein
MKRLASLGAGFLLCYGAAGAAERCPAEVRVSLPNFEIAPYVLGTDRVENPPGLLIEWMHNALTLAGCKARIVIKRRPPKRQLAELELGLLDILPGFAFSANPNDQLAFPMKDGLADQDLAVMTDTVSLYARADDRSVQWDGKTLRSTNPLVGSSTGGVTTDRIADVYGWQVEPAPTPQADLRKLIAGRIDVILEPDVVLGPYLAGADAPAVRKLSPPVQVTQRYAPVSERFAKAHPEFTARFWLELARQARAASPPSRP